MEMQKVGDILKERTLIIRDKTLKQGFTAIPNIVLRSPNLSLQAKMLYALLLSYAWQDGWCFPGQERLAKNMRISDRMVRDYLQELRAIGLIDWEQRGLTKTNVYYINEIPERKLISVQERK